MGFKEFKVLFILLSSSLCINAEKRGSVTYGEKQLGKDVPSSLLGEWISIKDYAMPITGLGDDEINKLMNINCVFESAVCIILKDTINNPRYALKRVNASQYFLDNYPNITKGFVGIKIDSIDIATVNAGKTADGYDIIDLHNRILIFLDGVFFQYQRPESLEKSNPIIVREIEFKGNEATLKNPSKIIDSLRSIANSLKSNKRLFVFIQGNTDNSENNGMEAETTIDNRKGSIRDLLLARAENVSQLLITRLKVSASQVRTSIGKMKYKRSATLMLFSR